MANYKDKKDGLPRGLYRKANNSVMVKVQVWNMQKNCSYSLNCGTYPNLGMAKGAKELVKEMLGPTVATSKKVRIYKIKEALNNYRIEIGLKPMRKANTKA